MRFYQASLRWQPIRIPRQTCGSTGSGAFDPAKLLGSERDVVQWQAVLFTLTPCGDIGGLILRNHRRGQARNPQSSAKFPLGHKLTTELCSALD
jgi:hypothetical protein